VPRNVYLAYRGDIEMEAYDHDTFYAIENASYEQLERIAQQTSMYDSSISNKLICLWRKKPGVADASVLSTFVAEQLLNAKAFADLSEKRKCLRLFAQVPEMGAARGWVFEPYVHYRFSTASPITGGITAYTLVASPQNPQEYRPDLRSRTETSPFPLINRERVLRASSDGVEPQEAEYHMPRAKNNPGFDSFLINGTSAYIFQMTVSNAHAVDSPTQKGLPLLQQMLPKGVPWHYVLVMPHTADVKSVKLTSVKEDWVNTVESFQLLLLE